MMMLCMSMSVIYAFNDDVIYCLCLLFMPLFCSVVTFSVFYVQLVYLWFFKHLLLLAAVVRFFLDSGFSC